jgi:hypothetical protein
MAHASDQASSRRLMIACSAPVAIFDQTADKTNSVKVSLSQTLTI